MLALLKPVFGPPPAGTCLNKRCPFVSASTGWNLRAQAMQFLKILLLCFALHAAMRSHVLRAIVSRGRSQVPPDLILRVALCQASEYLEYTVGGSKSAPRDYSVYPVRGI
jgi:hypothetical protein